MGAFSEKNIADSDRFGRTRQRIQDFQNKLEMIHERRKKTEEEENTLDSPFDLYSNYNHKLTNKS